MNGLNSVTIMGTVGADAQVTILEGDKSVAKLSIAVNDSYVDKTSGERKQTTEWVRVEAWNKLATFLGQWGKKGTGFLVQGRLKTDSWEKDGVTQYSTKVVAEKILFTGGKTNSAAPAQNVAAAQVNEYQAAAPAPVAAAPVAVAPVAAAPVAATPAPAGTMPDGQVDDLPF